jgi:NTP pyrophosphatase (non-canonical NTP hydrolase)
MDSLNHFMEISERTVSDELLKTERTFSPEQLQLLAGALGMAGEAGELCNLVYKAFFQGHPVTVDLLEKMENELGDVQWYWSMCARAIKASPSDILQGNVDKLLKRYPDKFSVERSLNRGSEG